MNTSSRLHSAYTRQIPLQGFDEALEQTLEKFKMRTLITAAAAAIALSVGVAAPALADDYNGNGQRYGQNQNHDDHDNYRQRDGQRGDYDRRDRGGRDFDRHGDRFDQWERGWRHDNRQDYRHHHTLSHSQLIRRLERQGYYGVRGLRAARWGFGWRAFAYTSRGRPVMLRINPYTGHVLEARRIWS